MIVVLAVVIFTAWQLAPPTAAADASDPAGGMILMATKDLKDGELMLFDFGVVSARETAVAFVP